MLAHLKINIKKYISSKARIQFPYAIINHILKIIKILKKCSGVNLDSKSSVVPLLRSASDYSRIHTLAKQLLLFPYSLVIYWLEGIFTSLRVIHCTEEATSHLVIFHWIHKLQSSALSRAIPKLWI